MAAWRRIAIERFPDLRTALQDRDYSIYFLFADLRRMAQDAHERRDSVTLRHIYNFAAWCSAQRNKDLWNAAGVSFYEHLFDRRDQWRAVAPWLSDRMIKDCWGLWELRLSAGELGKLRALLAQVARDQDHGEEQRR